jgi:hypothetical protein
MADTLTRWNVHFVADYLITTITVFAEDGADAESKAMDVFAEEMPMDFPDFQIQVEKA